MPHLTRFMHKVLKDLETAIRTDDNLRAILDADPGTADDVGAALALAITRRAEHPVTVAPGVRIDPNRPERESYRAAADELGRLAYKEDDSLLYIVEKSSGILGHRPGCRTSPATPFLGYLAANSLTRERKRLFGTEPSPQARELAKLLHAHKEISRFRLGVCSTEYTPKERRVKPYRLQPVDFA